MGEVNYRVLEGERNKREERLKHLSKEEINEMVKKLKDGKVAGENGIVNEVWKYGGKGVKNELRKICNRVWREGGWLDEWNGIQSYQS
ncbi:hypothetical protein WN55_10572 [Dufourea novaeangliae]|uniref:Uncharacterized protein n=1 Tax=Dufourea novaeangliae TaxID=178035 RepID=A0A154P460_DUFNO|nr:hypothetical protein WN55_10572 [Dufourea novaeangliae]